MTSAFKKEVFRKSIHTAGIFFLPILLASKFIFIGLFVVFLTIYLLIETLGKRNISIPLLSWMTYESKREDEKNSYAWGAILVSLSCIITPLFFPERVACVALAQIFIADSLAALFGMAWGRRKIPFSRRKSWLGSSVYFTSAFIVSLFFVSPLQALTLAIAGTLLEMIPWKHADNITIPMGISFLAAFFQ